MNNINSHSVDASLQLAGFIPCERTPGLFLIDRKAPITPAFSLVIVKRRGKVRLSGSVGVYFQEFEHLWDKSLSKEEKRTGFTLPLIMAIDNHITLLGDNVFLFTDRFEEVVRNSQKIYGLCLKLPNSIEEFDRVLSDKNMLGKPVSDYLHIFGYFDDDNIFLRKSVRFIHWFSNKWPEFAQDMYQCLADHQIKRLKLFKNTLT